MQKQKQVMYRLRLFAGKKHFIDVPLMFASPILANNWAFEILLQDMAINTIEITGSNNMRATIERDNCKPVETFNYSLFKPVTNAK